MSFGHLFLAKKNKQWIWLAIDRETGEIVGVAIGHLKVKPLKNGGIRCQVFTANVLLVTRIFGKLIKPFFQALVIGQKLKKPGKQTILNGLIVH
jgi:hypothetical protein